MEVSLASLIGMMGVLYNSFFLSPVRFLYPFVSILSSYVPRVDIFRMVPLINLSPGPVSIGLMILSGVLLIGKVMDSDSLVVSSLSDKGLRFGGHSRLDSNNSSRK